MLLLLSLCSAVRPLREVYLLIRVCVFLINFCPAERKTLSSQATGVFTYLSFSKCFMKFDLSSQQRS